MSKLLAGTVIWADHPISISAVYLSGLFFVYNSTKSKNPTLCFKRHIDLSYLHSKYLLEDPPLPI
jgi:hypothetical protein